MSYKTNSIRVINEMRETCNDLYVSFGKMTT